MTKAPASPKSPRKHHPPFAKLVVEAVEESEKHCLSAKAIYDYIESEYEGSLGATWREGAKGALKAAVAEGALVKPKVSGLYYLEDSPELRKAKAAATKKTKAAAHAHELEEEEEEAPETPKGRKVALGAKGGVKKVAASAARKKAAPAAAPARKAAAKKKGGAAAAAPESPRAARARSRAA